MENVYSMIIIHKHGCYIYMKWKEGEREQDTGETERVCAREGGWLREEVASVLKMTVKKTDHLK